MSSSTRFTTISAAIALTLQPSVAAATGSQVRSPAAPLAAPAAAQVAFDLKHHMSGAPVTSMSLAASQQTAAEMQDQPKRNGPRTATWIIVGGVVLLLVLVVAASAASPSPGPHEGAFD